MIRQVGSGSRTQRCVIGEVYRSGPDAEREVEEIGPGTGEREDIDEVGDVEISGDRLEVTGVDRRARIAQDLGEALRLTAQAGVLVSLTPVLLGLGFLYVVSVPGFESSPTVFLLGLPVLGWAASQLTLPVKRVWLVRPLSIGAGILAASGRGLYLILALIPLALAEATSGALTGRKKPLPWSVRGKSRLIYKGSS